ncbi:hypothetical protein DRQ00_12385 [candidate division KSB1 bacterium]|nr:MAG: hypothetical protein DRQ00_12385 [candidate division KSB1 bacterium]RKY86837.1 MAG: hypothetical protein DRQ11_07620 [candidate division KSB1 bacterium]
MEKISELLREDLVILNLKSNDKTKIIEQLVDTVARVENIKDKSALLKAILEREELESTGIGMGVAIPHCRTDVTDKIIVAFGRSIPGADFKSLDGKPTHLVFLIIAPEAEKDKYIKVLARISSLVRRDEFRTALMKAMTRGEVINLFAEREK